MTDLVGRKIVGSEYVETNTFTRGKVKTEALVLDDGSKIFALSDEEGNNVGQLICMVGNDEYYIFVE